MSKHVINRDLKLIQDEVNKRKMDEVNQYLKTVTKKFQHEPSLEKLDKAYTEIASKITANEEHFKYEMR